MANDPQRTGGEAPSEIALALLERDVLALMAEEAPHGLGLYITRQIVLAQGGSVEVDSGKDGTTFSIDLPRRVPPRPGAGVFARP